MNYNKHIKELSSVDDLRQSARQQPVNVKVLLLLRLMVALEEQLCGFV